MKKTSLTYISVLMLLTGMAGITLWRKYSLGSEFGFCILSLLLVWPLCCALSGVFWTMSGAKKTAYYGVMVIAAVAEPILAYLDMYDIVAVCLGAFATVFPALAGLAIGEIITNISSSGRQSK